MFPSKAYYQFNPPSVYPTEQLPQCNHNARGQQCEADVGGALSNMSDLVMELGSDSSAKLTATRNDENQKPQKKISRSLLF